jgi:hypothetical protein
VGFKLTTLLVMGTDCIDIGKSNFHAITTMTAPFSISYRLKNIIEIKT